MNEWMFYKACTMLLHTPNYMGRMQLQLLMRVKLIPKSLSVSLDKGETSCMFLLINVFYSVLIAEVVGCVGHFRKWTAFNFCFQL